MRPPAPTAAARSWPVSGLTTGKANRSRSLRVGTYAATGVQGTPIAMAGMAAYGRVTEQREWDYRFELAGSATPLHAECKEAIDHTVLYGLGGVALNLFCTCSEGGEARASLAFDGEKGRALVRGRGYDVSAAHVTDKGESTRAMLGYELKSKEGEGAVEITGPGQVYVPRDLPADAEPAFACLSAALLLHRPLQ
jgi:hypothetical protein